MIQRFHALHRVAIGLSAGAILVSCGCQNSKSNSATSTTTTRTTAVQQQDSRKPNPAAPQPANTAKPAAPDKGPAHKPASANKPATAETKPAIKAGETRRAAFTAANNPTTQAGRGAPDLEKPQSPAAWVFVDGKGGKYKEEGGNPLLQWFVDEAACSTPHFRVEAFEPLLGTPKDFKAVLRTVESDDGTDLVYGISAREGTFEVGKEYSLLNPGENFVIRNGLTGDEVKEIAPLPAGQYAIAAAIHNATTGKQSLAVTYFTVKSDE